MEAELLAPLLDLMSSSVLHVQTPDSSRSDLLTVSRCLTRVVLGDVPPPVSTLSSPPSPRCSVSFQSKMAPNSIHWFRKGLRLHDNPALREAVRGAGTVRCVYFLDPWFAGSSNVGVNRWR